MITRGISNAQVLTPIDPEPSTFSLPNSLPPQAADVACLVLSSHSQSNSICTSYNDRSRANSHSSINDQNERQIVI
jgi:hypothetical protein